LGLEAACSGFCRELAQQHNVKIDFRAQGIPEALPNEISLCLFRVMQDSLHNAVQYSGVSECEVSLIVAANEIQLSVRDSGVGFDTEVVSRGSGPGLISTKQRLRLVDGQLSVESHPQRGTTVIARVHFPTTAVGAVA